MVKWGIIGLGNIAMRFAKSLSYSNDGELYVIASKTKEKRNNLTLDESIRVMEVLDKIRNNASLN